MKIKFLSIIFSFSLLLPVKAQTVFYDASAFPILGKISEATETRYERLPAKLKEVSRPSVWNLGKHTAGLAIRFCSNSQQISVKWETHNNYMSHMAATGIKGLDLYCMENGDWTYVNTAIPSREQQPRNEATIVSNMERKEREFMLYLPLYDGIVSLEIGIDSTAFIELPKIDLPRQTKPVVHYGTSITQGASATRPGMMYTNILSRKLNREVINLGFSGNGLLDYEIAELMADCDASLFVLEFDNCTAEQIKERTEKFYRLLREKHPYTPIVFLEVQLRIVGNYDLSRQDIFRNNIKALREVFEELKAKKEKNIWLIPFAGQFDGEGTVDGSHYTDLGFMRFADYLYPKIQKIMGKQSRNKK